MYKHEFNRAYKALQGPRDTMLQYSKGCNYARGFLEAYGAFIREWENPCFTVEFLKEMIDEYKEEFDKGHGDDIKAGFVGCLLIIWNIKRNLTRATGMTLRRALLDAC